MIRKISFLNYFFARKVVSELMTVTVFNEGESQRTVKCLTIKCHTFNTSSTWPRWNSWFYQT